MAASAAQIAANRANSLLSTGPNTIAGKEASRRNSLKHGLTGAGVVIPGEDEHEVAIRVAALEGQLVGEGDVLGTNPVRHGVCASDEVSFYVSSQLRMEHSSVILDHECSSSH